MKLEMAIIAGPHQGKKFVFDGHDSFLVGRAQDAHFQLSNEDPYVSRRHFLVEMNPPRCRLIALSHQNATLLNGVRVQSAEVKDGDEISAGHTVFSVKVIESDHEDYRTLNAPVTLNPADWTSDYKPFSLAVPGYRIEGELGRGGMGVVYRATRLRDSHPVAIKTITPSEGTNRHQIDRFLRESKILAQLDHPNIVAFQEVGESASTIYLVMDLVDGPDLAARLREGKRTDIRTAVRIACQMLAGLAHAHEKRFVHRDIKPSNILISQVGTKATAKLADFGLARACESSRFSGLTMLGEIGGTPAFMAPEQVTHYRETKPPADQFSAAATLYYVLTGKNIHDLPNDIGEQLALIVTAEPVPIGERRADIPAKLASVIHKALAREPEDRYPDVLAFRKELKRFA